MRETPLFLGLTKPSMIFGLPLGYFISLAMASVLPFLLFDSMWFLLIFIVGYPPLWLIADRNPHLFQILNVTLSRTPRTATAIIDGGNRYVS
jgi:type IV secretion system protein VirB3